MRLIQKFALGTLILFTSVFVYILFTSPVGNKYSTEISFVDGIVYKVSDNQTYTGRIIDTLDNNIIEYDVKNGKKNGEFTVTYLNGQVKIHGFIVNNKNEGKWRYFNPEGELESIGSFTNDLASGKWTWYYSNGNIKQEGVYKNGKRHGVWMTYDKDGNFQSRTIFSFGEKLGEFAVPDLKAA